MAQMTEEDRIACRTPTEGRDGVTPIPAWKYHMVRKAILHAVEAAGPEGLPFSQLAAEVKARLSQSDLARLGALGWHCTTVKLEMEVAGDLLRAPGPGPQRLIRA
jgi:hypothetical protein